MCGERGMADHYMNWKEYWHFQTLRHKIELFIGINFPTGPAAETVIAGGVIVKDEREL